MLCIIEPNRRTHLLSSFRVFVHDGYCLNHGLSGSCTKEMHAVSKLLVWYKIPIWFQNTVCPKTKDPFPKIQASAYIQLVFTLASATACVNIYRDTTTADSHENVAWKNEFIFFTVPVVIIPTSLLCQMPLLALFNHIHILTSYSTISKFMRRMNCHCLFTSSTKREIRHFHG